MNAEKVETILEVIDDEIKGLPKAERLDILTKVRDTVDICIASIEHSE